MIFAVGCPRKDEKPAPPPAPRADPREGLPHAGTLDGQLGLEASSRLKDADTVTFEQLEAKLKDQGVTFSTVKQVMARNHLALYCVTADGTDGVIITVCEYPTGEAAVKGETESKQLATSIAGYSSRVHKKSVLHVVKKSTTPEETVSKLYAAFDGL